MEEYVRGTLDEALAKIEHSQTKKNTERIGNLFENLIPEVEEEPKITAKPKNPEVSENKSETESGTIDLTSVQKKIEQVLSSLGMVKFKPPAMLREIEKYQKLQDQTFNEPHTFNRNRMEEILQKAEKILQSQTGKNTEYKVQTHPELKKGVLKYQFIKPDEVVNTSLQNNTSSQHEDVLLQSFADTSYDGMLDNYEKHQPFANYINGKWVHDFYYAEGNIYKKLEQLEIDRSARPGAFFYQMVKKSKPVLTVNMKSKKPYWKVFYRYLNLWMKFISVPTMNLSISSVWVKLRNSNIITQAEHHYNRILGYSKEETEDRSYWKNQLPFHQKAIDSAQELVSQAREELSRKGVNVAEIEQQVKATDDKVVELDNKLEALPEIKENLIVQYRLEKEKSLKIAKNRNDVKERADENALLFHTDKPEHIQKNSEVIRMEQEQPPYSDRKR